MNTSTYLRMLKSFVTSLSQSDNLFCFSRKNSFRLLVALNETGQANGGLFWDDGETIGNDHSTLRYWYILIDGLLCVQMMYIMLILLYASVCSDRFT